MNSRLAVDHRYRRTRRLHGNLFAPDRVKEVDPDEHCARL
jgi:hypothetical protein